MEFFCNLILISISLSHTSSLFQFSQSSLTHVTLLTSLLVSLLIQRSIKFFSFSRISTASFCHRTAKPPPIPWSSSRYTTPWYDSILLIPSTLSRPFLVSIKNTISGLYFQTRAFQRTNCQGSSQPLAIPTEVTLVAPWLCEASHYCPSQVLCPGLKQINILHITKLLFCPSPLATFSCRFPMISSLIPSSHHRKFAGSIPFGMLDFTNISKISSLIGPTWIIIGDNYNWVWLFPVILSREESNS